MAQPSERVQEMMRKFEEQAAQAGRLRERMQEIKGRARSADGSVSVTVAPSGAVLDLQLTAAATRQPHSSLQQSIMTAIREATQDAAQQMDETVTPVLGDRAEQFKSAFNAHSPAPPPAPRHADDDDDFSDGSFLR
ncbi:YbaB/EbfC family nucleoid-associated protein [Saccharopolyspora sp. TS4A08]|uniref:YbaB/EbfC family nucleoid-associated protein n=1 Tax=Saccharopolyspora ipomoeae TaxID=3042027 RepID=A0ABT6PHU9_9PSEU|nr:YbaB/EbfC family nucleoid-associated protein [Saccharopolyspora sp. TS4A08]MDI2027576.1 YbaB/EbfC family nucleoid-associated protein [Saccharopolyspora sp. TS4A08]